MSARSPHLLQRGLEAALVVPVAIAGRVRSRLPALARHIENSRVVGRLVVDQGIAKASTLTSERPSADDGDDASPHSNDTPSSSKRPVDTELDQVEGLDPPSAIDDYASLAASQVVPRLSALSAGELIEVADYESATRRRRTILSAIERLSS